jgi:3-hydroxyacyl-[acyl-carrier-protein] dehydratase
MPPKFLVDFTQLNFDQPLYGPEQIRAVNPHRGDMEHLSGIVLCEADGRMVAFKDVRADEFWVPGHIPGRPILPGVIMIEAAAQMCSFHVSKFSTFGKGFIGFGGCEDVKFRQQVVPGQRLIIVGQKIWERHSRFGCKTQGIVDGQIAFEATIIGAQLG